LVEEKASEQLNTRVSLGGIDINFLEEITLEELYVEDRQGDTLLYSGYLSVSFEIWPLTNKTISIPQLVIRDTYVNFYKPEGEDSLNFAFIPEALASADTTTQQQDTTSSSWNIQAGQLFLGDIRFAYDADSTQMQLALDKLNLLFEQVSLEESLIAGEELEIEGLAFSMSLPATSADTSKQQPDTTDSNVLNPSGFTFRLELLQIADSRFAYQVGAPAPDSLRQMDFEDLRLAGITLKAEDIFVGEKDLSLGLPLLSFRESRSGFTLNQFAATYQMNMPALEAEVKALRTPYSELNGNIRYGMELTETTAAMMESIMLDASLEQALIGMRDVSYFTNALEAYPTLSELQPRLSLQSRLSGGEGQVDTLYFEVPGQAFMRAEASFRDLAALDSTLAGSPYFSVQLKEMQADYAFLSSLLDDGTAQYVDHIRPKQLSVTASARGRLDSIEAEASLQTGLGQLLAEGNYRQSSENAYVSANVRADRFDVSAIMLALGNPDSIARQYGRLSMRADVNLTQDYSPADTSISRMDADVVVENFGYKGHTYQDLFVRAEKMQERVEARVDYDDSLLRMHAEAEALLSGADSRYQLDLRLNEADLYRLNLIDDSLRIDKLRLSADASGNSIDNINGELQIDSLQITRRLERFQIDSIALLAQTSDTSRTFRFRSDNIFAELSGQFDLASMPQTIESFRQYYLTAYEAPLNGSDTISLEGPEQELYFELEIERTPKLAQAFVPELKITEAINASLYFNSRRRKLTTRAYLPRVMYADNLVDSLLFTAQTSRNAIRFRTSSDYTNVAGLSIPEWQLSGNLSGVTNDSLNGDADRLLATDVDFNFRIGAQEAPYRVDLNAIFTTTPDSLTVRLDSSELVLEDKPWEISPNARLMYADNYLEVRDFFIRQGTQQLQLSTSKREGTTNLQFLIEQLALGPLLSSLDLEDLDISGKLHLDSELADLFGQGDLQANMQIDSFKVQQLPVGDFALDVGGEQLLGKSGGKLNMDMSLEGQNNQLGAEARYLLDSSYVDASINMERFELNPWQSFMSEYVDELGGSLQAELRIEGKTDDPNISGGLTFADEVTITPAITSAVYYIDDQRINFEGEQMVFNEFTILDSARTPASIDGSISFANLSNPGFDLAFETDDFLFVNSEDFENDSFFGRAMASASLRMDGPLEDLDVSGNAAVNEGTNMTIALISGAEDASRADWVNFVNNNLYLQQDSLQLQGQAADSLSNVPRDTTSISGLSVNTVIDINPEAELTILLDPQNGDKITARGDAELQVSMNPGGDISVQGAYLLQSGSYTLTFVQLIQKEFSIQEGSSLTWTGDPTDARFDITAIYTAQTTLDELIEPFRSGLADNQLEAVSARQEVNVLMNISGQLTDPALNFDIEVPALAGGSAGVQEIQTLIDRVTRNQTSLYKQVFGLIVLNRFLPPTGGIGGGGGGGIGYTAVNERINESVSQLLSGVLNELTQQYLGGVQISMGLETNELQADNSALADRDLDVQLSKTFFDNRLTVRVGGMTSLNTNDTEGTSAMMGVESDDQFYGEFEVLYRIDAKGNLNVRIFQESDRNVFTNEVQQEQGVSLSYQRSFDEFFGDGEVLRSDYPGFEQKETEDEETPEDEQETDTAENTALDNAQRRLKMKKP
jgi:hypothetical protein